MTDRLGQQLGNYRLMRLIGQGGFAEVYLGEHVHLETQAAIKVLHTQLTAEDFEHFRAEARTIARLKHPHIVRVLDFGIEGSTPFLAMEYAAGGTLRTRHPRGTRLPLPTILTSVQQVAQALQYAHDQKLIHRDVKPENMLLDEREQVVLSDFGIAIVAHSSRSDRTQDTTGTIAYMAPEQIQAHPRPASDQYALGIVVYEWLCGERPFGGSFTEIAAKQVLMPPPSLREKLPELSPVLEQVVLTALAKDPKERFASVHAFANALLQASQAEPTLRAAPAFLTAPSLSPSSFTLRSAPAESEAHPSATVASQRTSGPVEPLTTAPPLLSTQQSLGSTVTTVSPSKDTSRPGLSRRTIVVGLSMTGLAVVGGGFTWFALHRLSSPDHRRSTPTPTPHTSPSPTATAIPVGTTLYTYHGHAKQVNTLAWNPVLATALPASQRIASGSSDKTVQVWNATDGSQACTYRGHSDHVTALMWSPDGRLIASGGFDTTVQVWQAE